MFTIKDRRMLSDFIADLIASGLSDQDIAKFSASITDSDNKRIDNVGFISIIRDLMTRKPEEEGVEIQKVLACSTSHLTEEECDIILPSCKDELQVFEHEYGLMVRVPCEINDPDFEDEMSALEKRVGASIMKLMRYAQHIGCWAINFDRDALELDTNRFKVYEW